MNNSRLDPNLSFSVVALCALAGACVADAPVGEDGAPLLTLEQVRDAPTPVDSFVDESGVVWTFDGYEPTATAPITPPPPELVVAPDQVSRDQDDMASAGQYLIFADGRRYHSAEPLAAYVNLPGQVAAPRMEAPDNLPPSADDVDGLPDGAVARIIGSDGRTRYSNTTDFPNRAIAYMTSDGGACSGAMVGSRLVLTAGHCVHDGGGGAYYNVVVYPGADITASPSAPYGGHTELARRVPDDWKDHGNSRSDWAIIVLDSKPGAGYFGYADYSKSTLKSITVRNRGYPGTAPDGHTRTPTLWGMACEIKSVETRKIYHDCDASSGQSGSPVWRRVDDGGDYEYYIVGVHSGGGGGTHTNNRATRVTEENDLFPTLELLRAMYP